jgi:hypothetical protein
MQTSLDTYIKDYKGVFPIQNIYDFMQFFRNLTDFNDIITIRLYEEPTGKRFLEIYFNNMFCSTFYLTSGLDMTENLSKSLEDE